jgi:tetratricopeptide (TPR) repeat protein
VGMIGSMLRGLAAGFGGKRRWTPSEVRELIESRRLDEAEEAVRALHEDTPQRPLVVASLRAEIAFRQHRDEQAEALFRQALSEAPGLPDAHYGLSLVMLARGEKEVALRHAQFAANNGHEARFNAQLGLCQLELQNFLQADLALSRATRLNPLDKASWNNLGIAKRARGHAEKSRAAFKRALELDPSFEQADQNLKLLEEEVARHGESAPSGGAPQEPAGAAGDDGLAEVAALASAGDLPGAIKLCEALYDRSPNDGRLAIELYRLCCRDGDVQSGMDVLQAHLARHSDDIDVVGELGRAHLQQNESKLAKPLIERAIEQRPDDVRLLLAMAHIRSEQMRYVDAAPFFERALELEPSVDNKGHLAANLVARCEYEKALAYMEEMIAEAPQVQKDLVGLYVYSYTCLGRHAEAMPLLDEAIAANPNDANRRFPRATIHLLQERFEEGWADYAYRNLSSTEHLRMAPFPLWRGEPLEGKRILVLAEQGLGDQVMFASCLPDLLALQPAHCVVEAVDRVAPTLARSFPGVEVVATRQDNAFDWMKTIGHIDCFVMMGDLPGHFRRRHADFPRHDGYMKAAPDRVQHWRSRLAALGPRPKIGVSWRGGTEMTRQVMRTMDVTCLHGLAPAGAADWISLQYGKVDDDLRKARDAGLELHDWPEAIKDLDEFAALISALDLVITVCNTTVHYAGALGQPVWVMAPKVPEWRYGLYSESLPWYPSSRMYRQIEAGDWSGLLDRVRQDLSHRLAAGALPGRSGPGSGAGD